MKLTLREKEILEILKRDPLKSQEELAEHLGTSRSSLAVHISNLMKKGYIIGKGYVFNEKASIVVLGQAYVSIDIEELKENTTIDLRYKGFGYEVSGLLANFGAGVKLISLLGNDEIANGIIHDLKEKNVDITNIYSHPDKRTCRKLLQNNVQVLEEGYSLEEYEKIIDKREWVIFNCDWLVVEKSLQRYVQQKFFDLEDSPFFCTCSFIDEDIPAYLNGYSLLVLGVEDITDRNTYIAQVEELMNNGTQNCIITDGKNSILSFSNFEINEFTLLPKQNFDNRDKLHFFLAGFIHGLSSGFPLRQAIRIGIGTALGR